MKKLRDLIFQVFHDCVNALAKGAPTEVGYGLREENASGEINL